MSRKTKDQVKDEIGKQKNQGIGSDGKAEDPITQ